MATEREAEKALTRLLAEVDALKTARTKASFGFLLDRWFRQHEVGPSTRATYESLIRNHIRPALGGVALTKLHRSAAEILECFYGELRRCSKRCDGRPSIDHRVEGPHSCEDRGCRLHRCEPLAASSVRQIHAVISGALSAAVRWGWLPFNPAEAARPPAKVRPNPDPPSAEDAARLIEEAWRQDEQWGLYLWLAMVTGARRGELLALRWKHVDFNAGFINIRRNYVRAAGEGHEKDTKSHQMRRLSIDQATLDLLRDRQARCAELLELAGVDLRTVAGRLGHGDGDGDGTTTPRPRGIPVAQPLCGGRGVDRADRHSSAGLLEIGLLIGDGGGIPCAVPVGRAVHNAGCRLTRAGLDLPVDTAGTATALM